MNPSPQPSVKLSSMDRPGFVIPNVELITNASLAQKLSRALALDEKAVKRCKRVLKAPPDA